MGKTPENETDQRPQYEKFVEAAIELETNDSKKNFDAILKQIGRPKSKNRLTKETN